MPQAGTMEESESQKCEPCVPRSADGRQKQGKSPARPEMESGPRVLRAARRPRGPRPGAVLGRSAVGAQGRPGTPGSGCISGRPFSSGRSGGGGCHIGGTGSSRYVLSLQAVTKHTARGGFRSAQLRPRGKRSRVWEKPPRGPRRFHSLVGGGRESR